MTKGGSMKGFVGLFILLACVACWAGPYIEAGTFYTNDKFWSETFNGYRTEESGTIGHLAAGYEIERGSWLLDFQARHESDPRHSGGRDLRDRDTVGVSVRYRF